MKKLPRKRSYDSLILIFPFQEKQFYPTKPRHLSSHYRSFARRYKTSSFSIERLAKETSEARIQRDFSNGCTWRMIKSLRHERPCRVSRSSARWRAISQNRVTCTPRFINYSSQSYHGPRVFIRAFIFFFFFADERKTWPFSTRYDYRSAFQLLVEAIFFNCLPSSLHPNGTSLLTKIKGLLTRTLEHASKRPSRSSSKGTPWICTCSSSLPHRPRTLPSFL